MGFRRKLLSTLFRRQRKSLTPMQTIAIVFAGIILLGTLLLMLPAASRSGESVPMIDALFTAGAVGMLIASNATISGADGGCQAETGAAAAMAAAVNAAITAEE